MFHSFLESHQSNELCLSYGELDSYQQELKDLSEKKYASEVSTKRAAEFKAGRNLARKTMKALGVPESPIPQNPETRAPIWPLGLVGSISHNGNHVITAVGKANAIQSIGLDIENIERIKEKTFSYFLGNREYAWIQTCPSKKQRLYAGCIFSAKESFYKWQYPLTHSWIGFKDVEVNLSPSESSFEITLLKTVGEFKAGFEVQGHATFQAPFWLTLIYTKPIHFITDSQTM